MVAFGCSLASDLKRFEQSINKLRRSMCYTACVDRYFVLCCCLYGADVVIVIVIMMCAVVERFGTKADSKENRTQYVLLLLLSSPLTKTESTDIDWIVSVRRVKNWLKRFTPL